MSLAAIEEMDFLREQDRKKKENDVGAALKAIRDFITEGEILNQTRQHNAFEEAYENTLGHAVLRAKPMEIYAALDKAKNHLTNK